MEPCYLQVHISCSTMRAQPLNQCDWTFDWCPNSHTKDTGKILKPAVGLVFLSETSQIQVMGCSRTEHQSPGSDEPSHGPSLWHGDGSYGGQWGVCRDHKMLVSTKVRRTGLCGLCMPPDRWNMFIFIHVSAPKSSDIRIWLFQISGRYQGLSQAD